MAGSLSTRQVATTLIFAVAMALNYVTNGQDIHFSQIDINPVLYNPAYCGFFDGEGRFGATYRNQWASVSRPFQTLAATAEVPLIHGRGALSGFSLGVVANADRAGSLNYGSGGAEVIAAYFISLNGHSDNLLSVALQGGVAQVGFDDENIDLAEGHENFETTRANLFTMGIGAAWFRQLTDELCLKAGVAAFNLNQPSYSYLGSDENRLARRLNTYVRAEWQCWPRVSLMPIAGYQRQGQYNEAFYGADVRWYINESPLHYTAFTAGVTLRHADAAVVTAALERGPFTFAFSYDANFSRLAKASHSIGSFEVGIVYRLAKAAQRYRALPCPII